MTKLIVLGVDGADRRLLERWDCDNLLLESHDHLETFTYGHNVPSTIEVWPSIATGVHPEEHGVFRQAEKNADSRLRMAAVRANNVLPSPLREKIIDLNQQINGKQYPQTDLPNVFETGNVLNWPGITPCDIFLKEADWFVDLKEGDLTIEEFREQSLGTTGQCIGWLAAQHQAGVPIAGAHVHTLDHFGHIYASRPSLLRDIYKQVDTLVGWLRQHVDGLVILSDHGMQTSLTEDPNPGVHSMEAVISYSGEDADLPTTVLDVRQWLEGLIDNETAERTNVEFDAPTKHLKELGYL